MSKLYIKVPAMGGTPPHWSLISTNAAGPAGDAEGLLNLRQPDSTWHRHVPRNYPAENALRLRLHNGDWPDVLHMALVLPSTPDAQYTMLGRVPVSPPLPSPGGHITSARVETSHDGSTPINPQPYFGPPFDVHIPAGTTAYYAGREPSEFYPRVSYRPRDAGHPTDGPSFLENDNGPGSVEDVTAGFLKTWRDWQVNWAAYNVHAPYWLFPYRFVQAVAVQHVVVDLRWVRRHHPLNAVSAAELVFYGEWSLDASSTNAATPVGMDPTQLFVRLMNTTGGIPLREKPIDTANVYRAYDPTAMVFDPFTTGPYSTRRPYFTAAGAEVASWNAFTDAADPYKYLNRVTAATPAGASTRADNGSVRSRAQGQFEHRILITPADFDSTDHLEFTVICDVPEGTPPEVAEPADNQSMWRLSANLRDVHVNLYK